MYEQLVAALKERQGELSQAQFARMLGVAQPSISRLYSGEQLVGAVFASKIVARFPELRELVTGVVLGVATEVTDPALSAA